MSLPITTDLLQLVGVAVLIFMLARSRPSPMTNGTTAKLLLAQLAEVQADRDKWRELADRVEHRAQDLERECQMYRRTIQRLNEDCDRQRQAPR